MVLLVSLLLYVLFLKIYTYIHTYIGVCVYIIIYIYILVWTLRSILAQTGKVRSPPAVGSPSECEHSPPSAGEFVPCHGCPGNAVEPSIPSDAMTMGKKRNKGLFMNLTQAHAGTCRHHLKMSGAILTALQQWLRSPSWSGSPALPNVLLLPSSAIFGCQGGCPALKHRKRHVDK